MSTFVFIADYFPLEEGGAIYPEARAREISACGSDKVRYQKQFVWRILAYGVEKAWKKDIASLHLSKTENGKWVCEEGYFSLSHSSRGVAVALSHNPVGVDREELDNAKFSQKLYERIACANERRRLGDETSADEIAALWTKKESIFKREGGKLFLPDKIDTTKEKTFSVRFRNSVLSLAGLQEGDESFFYGVDENFNFKSETLWLNFTERL